MHYHNAREADSRQLANILQGKEICPKHAFRPVEEWNTRISLKANLPSFGLASFSARLHAALARGPRTEELPGPANINVALPPSKCGL